MHGIVAVHSAAPTCLLLAARDARAGRPVVRLDDAVLPCTSIFGFDTEYR